jgi:hypothetical protein
MVRQSEDTSARDTDAGTNGWTAMSAEELLQSDLLTYLNRTAFWPLGMALTIVANSRDDLSRAVLAITMTDPPEEIVSGLADKEHEEKFRRGTNWAQGRRDAIELTERKGRP